MTELLTAAQMRAIETAAIESGAVTGLELMERAGRGVVEAVFEEWPELAQTPHRAVVLCGPGNNGGDGFVVARLLKEWGWEVEVFLYGDADKLPPDARVNYERWVALGEVVPWIETDFINGRFYKMTTFDSGSIRGAAIVIDALFGTGLARPLEIHGDLWQAFDCDTGPAHGLVNIDIASGICADSGTSIGMDIERMPRSHQPVHALEGELTVTFHSRKIGHVVGPIAPSAGKVVVKDIGLHKTSLTDPSIVRLVTRPNAAMIEKKFDHKFSHGHALVLTGGAGRTGAARLTARGALRMGAGLVTLGVPGNAQMEVAGQITALMLTRIEDGDGLEEALTDPRINALCLGPGMGVARAKALLPVALEQTRPGPRAGASGHEVPGQARDRGCVLDADALTALAEDPALFDMLHAGCLLTPHGGEFARLFPEVAEKLNATPTKGPAYSKVDATREAAKRAGCTVLFKGADTVIADPNGRCSINSAHYERAAPWLATAGSGDVLAGFAAGLLARGFDPMRAAETAAWLHVECARSFGPGLIAEDLPEELPKVFRALGL